MLIRSRRFYWRQGQRRLLRGCFDELLGIRPFDVFVVNVRPKQARDAVLLRGKRRDGGGTDCSQVRNLDFEQVFRLELEQSSPINTRVGARRCLDARCIQAERQG